MNPDLVSLGALRIADATLVPLRVNPAAGLAERHVEVFAEHYGMNVPTLKGFNTMGGFLFPDASVERLSVIGKYNLLLFYVDDTYGDTEAAQIVAGQSLPPMIKQRITRCCTALGGQRPTSLEPESQAFYAVWKEMSGYAGRAWLTRLQQSTYDHLMATIDPAGYGWKPDGTTTVEEYIRFREFLSGMYPTMDLIEMASDISISDEELRNPVLAALRKTCARIGGLTNDLFSYEKEVLTHHLPLNLVTVIQSAHCCSFREAVPIAIQIINVETNEFFANLTKAKRWGGPIRQYVEGLEYQVAATWHWQMYTERYRSPRSPFIELRTRLPEHNVRDKQQ